MWKKFGAFALLVLGIAVVGLVPIGQIQVRLDLPPQAMTQEEIDQSVKTSIGAGVALLVCLGLGVSGLIWLFKALLSPKKGRDISDEF